MNCSLGIDLATTKGATGICEIDWSRHSAVVEVGSPTNDQLVEQVMSVPERGGWTAIDAPFGFPAAFSRSVASWSATGRVEVETDDALIRRVTDRIVHARQVELDEAILAGKPPWPLSSVVERITPTTVRAMQLLTRLTSMGSVDRIGLSSRVVETYPIAALRIWGIWTGDYKTVPDDADTVMTNLCDTTGIGMPHAYRSLRPKNRNDAVDALTCALIARTVELEHARTGPRDQDSIETISEEGWIHLPPTAHALATLRTQ